MYNAAMVTNVGQLLKKERESKGISLAEVEKATKIRINNLKAIEAEEWTHFPSRTYVQGVIKTYGSYLKLDEDKLNAYFRREYERKESLKFKKRTVGAQFTPLSKKVVKFAITIIVILFGCFFGYQLYLFSVPPTVTILEPKATEFKLIDKVTLKGSAAKETVITINGRQVFLDDKNIFQTDIPLPEDSNPVTIEATGANGKKTIIKKVFIRK